MLILNQCQLRSLILLVIMCCVNPHSCHLFTSVYSDASSKNVQTTRPMLVKHCIYGRLVMFTFFVLFLPLTVWNEMAELTWKLNDNRALIVVIVVIIIDNPPLMGSESLLYSFVLFLYLELDLFSLFAKI